MICTLTLNPAIDKSSSVDRLAPEKKMRCGPLLNEAGGGGINISKALRELGVNSHAIFPSGGPNGRLLQQLLADAGIPYSAIKSSGATRESFNITEQATGTQYRFIMPGTLLQPAAIDRCLHKLEFMKPRPAYIIASGSLPPGAPPDFFANVAKIARRLHARAIIDTSGEPLRLAMEEGVFMVKPNLSELHQLTGKFPVKQEDIIKAGRELLKKYPCEALAISMGAGGAVLLTRNTVHHACAPAARRLSTSGAGDSMVAGMTYMLLQEKNWQDVLHFGIACGTAATMNSGTKLFRKEDVYTLLHTINTQHPLPQ